MGSLLFIKAYNFMTKKADFRKNNKEQLNICIFTNICLHIFIKQKKKSHVCLLIVV